MATRISRQDLFAQASKLLRQEFEHLRLVPHSGVKGNESERILRDFLNNHLPERFKAGSGFVLDPAGDVSRQCDIVVYDALNCPVYRWSQEAAIYPSDNVAMVIEVKSSLDKARIEEASENIREVKSLAKTTFGEEEGRYRTLGVLFAYESALSWEKTIEHFLNSVAKTGVGHHIDLLVVLDKGLITWMASIPIARSTWSAAILHGVGPMEGTHYALGVHETGVDTLDVFLRMVFPHLTHFRMFTPHPGFDWRSTAAKGTVSLSYVFSVTNETDEVRRHEILKAYAEEAEALMRSSPPRPAA